MKKMPPNTSLAKYLRRIKLFLFFFILCLLFFLLIFFADKFFSVKNIQVVSDRNFSLANKDRLIGKNLFFLDKDKIAKQTIKENFYLKVAEIEKIWPDTVKVSVRIYDPCALLIVNGGFFNLSCDGRILERKNNKQPFFPVINYYQKLNNNFFQTGDWIDYEDIKKTLHFVNQLKQLDIVPLTIDIKGQDMLLFKLIDGKEIIFSNSKDREVQDYQLELIVKQFKIEGKEFKKIDLRFNKPIIQF